MKNGLKLLQQQKQQQRRPLLYRPLTYLLLASIFKLLEEAERTPWCAFFYSQSLQ
jgi:hypothetical protein